MEPHPLQGLKLEKELKIRLVGGGRINCTTGSCARHFPSVPYFKLHYQKVHSAVNLRCQYCNLGNFGCQNSFRLHVQTFHEGVKDKDPLMCGKCGKTSKTQYALWRHIRESHRERTYPCGECGAVFTRPENRKVHFEHKHSGTPISRIECRECGKTFLTKPSLRQHVRIRHRDDGVRHKCPTCPKLFKEEKALGRHIKWVHRLQRDFGCEVCQMSFKSSHHLVRHEGGAMHQRNVRNMNTPKITRSKNLPKKKRGRPPGSKKSDDDEDEDWDARKRPKKTIKVEKVEDLDEDDNPSGIDIKPAQKTEDENETELDVKPVFKHPEIVPLPIELLENPLFEENGDNFKDVSVKQENPGNTLSIVKTEPNANPDLPENHEIEENLTNLPNNGAIEINPNSSQNATENVPGVKTEPSSPSKNLENQNNPQNCQVLDLEPRKSERILLKTVQTKSLELNESPDKESCSDSDTESDSETSDSSDSAKKPRKSGPRPKKTLIKIKPVSELVSDTLSEEESENSSDSGSSDSDSEEETTENTLETSSSSSSQKIKVKPERSFVKAKKFYCMYCEVPFPSLKVVQSHEVACGTEMKSRKNPPCPICQKRLQNNHHLKLHMIIHDDKRPWKCKLCPMDYKRRRTLETHEDTVHRGAPTYWSKYKETDHSVPCPVCGKVLTSPKNCKRHMEEQHGEQRTYRCTHCPRKFRRERGYRRHLNEEHDEKRERFSCRLCNSKPFSSKRKLEEHLRRKRHLRRVAKQQGVKNYPPDVRLKARKNYKEVSSESEDEANIVIKEEVDLD